MGISIKIQKSQRELIEPVTLDREILRKIVRGNII